MEGRLACAAERIWCLKTVARSSPVAVLTFGARLPLGVVRTTEYTQNSEGRFGGQSLFGESWWGLECRVHAPRVKSSCSGQTFYCLQRDKEITVLRLGYHVTR